MTGTGTDIGIRRQWLGLSAAVLCLCGCMQRHADISMSDPARPADLTLEFHVIGEPAPGHPLRQTSMYVVEPDRRLRVSIGFRSATSFYPQVARVLTAWEYRELVELVYERHLMAEPTGPIAEAAVNRRSSVPVLYRVDLSGWGLINRYDTTPEESPPTEALLVRLAALSGLNPPWSKTEASGEPKSQPVELKTGANGGN